LQKFIEDMFNYTKRNHKGFTLIELLIVIAIIGILATMVLGSLNAARIKARDAQRVSDLRQIRNALLLYYDDHGSYPNADGAPLQSSNPTEWNTLAAALAPYIRTLPVDPLNTGVAPWRPWNNGIYAYLYVTASWYNEYDLIAQFEDHGNNQRNEIIHYYPYHYWGPGADWSAGSPYMFTDGH
jgi:type II secretion system protein G